MPTTAELTALIGSRICHDLISPLGAIGNGLELLGISRSGTGPEFELISQSVANANARIRFFRIAFGAAARDARLGRPEILSILDDLTAAGRLKVDWHVAGDQSRRDVKLAFLALQCLETAMPYGGRISFSGDGLNWQAQGIAPKLKPDPALWALLNDPGRPAELTAAQVQYALLPLELAQQERRLEVDLGATEIRLSW